MIFLEKKNVAKFIYQKLNARLAEIYRMLLKLQDLGDIIMYSPDVDMNIKCVFLAWYQMKLNIFGEKLDRISAIVIGE